MKLSVQQAAIQPFISAVFVVLAIFSALNYQGHDYSYRWNMLALFILLALSVVHLIRNYPQALQLSRQYALLSYGLLMLWTMLSLFWSAVPSDSLLAWLTQMTGLFALYLGYQASPAQWRAFKALLLPLVLVVATYTLYQSQVLHIARPSGFLLNWNSNAAFLGLLILPFCALFLQTEKAIQRHALGVFLLYCTLAMAATQSRGGLLVILIGLLPLCWISFKQKISWRAIALLLAYLLLGYVAADFLQGGAFSGRMVQQMASGEGVAGTLESLGSGRHALWAAGWEMYLDKPFLGWGQGMYHWLYPQYRNPLLVEAGQMVHNDYLEALLGLGPVGLLLLLAFLGCVARLLWCTIRAENLPSIALAGGAMGILIHSFLTFNLAQSAIVIVLGLFVGHLSKDLQGEPSVDVKPQCFDKTVYVGIVAVSGLAFSLWLGTLFLGFRQAELAAHELQPGKRLAYLDSASKWLPYMEQYDALRAATAIDLLKQENPAGMTAEGHRALVKYALKNVDTALSKNPLRALSYRNRAELLETREQTIELQQQIEDAYLLTLLHNPYDLDARYRLAEYLEQQEREVEAYRLLFAGLDKTYFTDLKTGLGFLMKLKQILEAVAISNEQIALLDLQMEQLVLRMMKYKNGQFTLRNIGIKE